MELEEVKLSCSQCDNDHFKFWGKEFTGVKIDKCQKCNLRLVNPRKKMDNLQEEVYGDHYWVRYGLGIQDQKKLKNLFNYDYLSLLKALEYNETENPSILDIGVGQGGFLKVAKMSGFNKLTANDINAAKKSELDRFGIPLVVGDITKTDVGEHDIINAQHVMEHVPDPFEFLKSIKDSLKPNGVAHIVVPNEGGLVANQKSLLSKLGLKKQPFKHLTPWHHIFMFDKKSLLHVLEDTGFEVLYIGTRNNIKSKGMLYELIHKVFDSLRWNTHLEVVVRPV